MPWTWHTLKNSCWTWVQHCGIAVLGCRSLGRHVAPLGHFGGFRGYYTCFASSISFLTIRFWVRHSLHGDQFESWPHIWSSSLNRSRSGVKVLPGAKWIDNSCDRRGVMWWDMVQLHTQCQSRSRYRKWISWSTQADTRDWSVTWGSNGIRPYKVNFRWRTCFYV